MRRLLLGLLATCACSGQVDSMGVGGEPAIAFVSPEVGALTPRDGLDDLGSRVAALEVELEVGGVVSVELRVGGERLVVIDADSKTLSSELEIPRSGSLTLTADGFDIAGELVATASIGVEVVDPDFSCTEWLDFFGVTYVAGPAEPGIPEPVTAEVPIHGIPYRYTASAERREEMLADCSLIHALAESAGLLRERGVVEVADIGIYNYRCIGGGAPPDCPNGISQHAYAKAIDIAGYTTDDGTTYSVNDDWIIDGDSEDTCTAATEGDKDAFLHEIICAQKARGIWNIALTPNYNADHRDHFHVDLTDNGDFLGRGAPRGH